MERRRDSLSGGKQHCAPGPDDHRSAVRQTVFADHSRAGWDYHFRVRLVSRRRHMVLQAPQDIYDTTKTSRQDFSTWESVGSTAIVLSNPTSAVMTLTFSGPYTLQADYQQQYLVTANSPFGSLNHDWVTDGNQEQLSAPDTQVVVTGEEQYIFTAVDGHLGAGLPQGQRYGHGAAGADGGLRTSVYGHAHRA